MEQKYDHVLIHAESSLEGKGTEIQTAGQPHNVVKMLAIIIANLSISSGMGAAAIAAMVLAELPDVVRDCQSHPRIDLGAIERAKEGLTHE